MKKNYKFLGIILISLLATSCGSIDNKITDDDKLAEYAVKGIQEKGIFVKKSQIKVFDRKAQNSVFSGSLIYKVKTPKGTYKCEYGTTILADQRGADCYKL